MNFGRLLLCPVDGHLGIVSSLALDFFGGAGEGSTGKSGLPSVCMYLVLKNTRA